MSTLSQFVEEFDLLPEAIFDANRYTWYTFDRDAPVQLTRQGKTVNLNKGDAFGIRAATSADGKWRVIVKSKGPTHVYSLDRHTAQRLTNGSKRLEEAVELDESDHLFNRSDDVMIDPDRSDVHDVMNALMPSLIKMAYTFLYHDKVKHERKHSGDEGEDQFDFSAEALRDEVQQLITSLCKRLEDQSNKDIDDDIERLKADFKHPLTTK
jgi:hypothetical protein